MNKKDYRIAIIGADHADPLPLRPKNFYTDNDIELIRKIAVTSIDPSLRRIVLSTGEIVDYT